MTDGVANKTAWVSILCTMEKPTPESAKGLGPDRLEPEMVEQIGRGSKHAYHPPRLLTYGSIERITRTVGTKGRKDAPRTTRRTGF